MFLDFQVNYTHPTTFTFHLHNKDEEDAGILKTE